MSGSEITLCFYHLTAADEDAIRAKIAEQNVTDAKVWREFSSGVPMPELSPLPEKPQIVPQPRTIGLPIGLELRG